VFSSRVVSGRIIFSIRDGVVRSLPVIISFSVAGDRVRKRTLRHSPSAPLPRNRRLITALSMPWCSYLLPLIFDQFLRKVVLLLLRDVVVELRGRSGVGVVVFFELGRFSPQP
jgi:hypothetical protein